MNFKFLCLNIVMIVNLFADNYQREFSNNLQETFTILVEAHTAILRNKDKKLYIDETRIIPYNNNYCIELDNGDLFEVYSLEYDEGGIFLPCQTLQELTEKLFKCVCQNCSNEWFGGILTYCCPRCGSYNYTVVPNW